MKLVGRRVLITGAGCGLGKALARACLQRGATVVVTDRDATRVEEAVRELAPLGSVVGLTMDVCEPASISAARDRLRTDGVPVDVLVNNAGVVFAGEFESVALERHAATTAVNLQGVMNVTHTFLPDLLARPEAHVVNIASAAATVALPMAASYAASKWGVLGFGESLREELRLRGQSHVGVTAICPSYITTGLFAGARPPRFTRWLTPEQVAAAAVDAIERRREFVMLPWTAALLHRSLGWLPRTWFRRVCRAFGVAESMTQWQGRAGGV